MLPQHLGGHQNITHIDQGILEYFIHQHQASSFIDVGCGPGGQVKLAKKLGMQSYGIDGDYTLQRDFDCIIHDYTLSACNLPLEQFDLGWSVEFVEHVEETFVENYIDTFKRCKHLVITHAPPNKYGHHHVNCKPSEYWINLFYNYGLEYKDSLTLQVKQVSSMKREFIKNNGLVFVNRFCI